MSKMGQWVLLQEEMRDSAIYEHRHQQPKLLSEYEEYAIMTQLEQYHLSTLEKYL